MHYCMYNIHQTGAEIMKLQSAEIRQYLNPKLIAYMAQTPYGDFPEGSWVTNDEDWTSAIQRLRNWEVGTEKEPVVIKIYGNDGIWVFLYTCDMDDRLHPFKYGIL